jgi:hypothetical protein
VALSGGRVGKVRRARGAHDQCRASEATAAVPRPGGWPAHRDRRRGRGPGRSRAPTAHRARSSRSATAGVRCRAGHCRSSRRLRSPRCPAARGGPRQAVPANPSARNTAGHGLILTLAAARRPPKGTPFVCGPGRRTVASDRASGQEAGGFGPPALARRPGRARLPSRTSGSRHQGEAHRPR